MLATDLSEHCTPPRLLLIHEPDAWDTFDGFSARQDNGSFLAECLFREVPAPETLREQHQQFAAILARQAEVVHLPEVLGPERTAAHAHRLRANPNHLYTRDAVITLPWVPGGYIPCNMKKPVRSAEPRVLAEVAELFGCRKILDLPADLVLEGGDVVPFCYSGKRALLVGYGPRTSERTLYHLRDRLVCDGLVDEVLGIRLADWRINLDGCFLPVSARIVVTHPASILEGVRLERGTAEPLEPLSYFAALGFELVEATAEESFLHQACNFVCLGGGSLVAYGMTGRINTLLRSRGLDVVEIEGSELVKGNGGPRCMTRPFY